MTTWTPPGFSVCGDSSVNNTGVDCHVLLQGIFPTQGSNPGPPALQVDSLPSEPPGKPKNTGVGSLSLLQGIFPTQGDPAVEPGCPALQADFSPAELPGNTVRLKEKSVGEGEVRAGRNRSNYSRLSYLR